MLDSLLKFTQFLHKFQQVKRTIYVKGEDRMENDLEHAGQLALVAWFLAKNTSLNQERVIKYALAHDLVEVYAGDTFIYETDETKRASKKQREQDALARIEKEFPEFPDLREILHSYEERKDPEARFTYALDKLLPILNNYLDGGRFWKDYKVNLKMVVERKKDKIKISPELEPYWDEVMPLLEKNQKELFGSESQ